MPFTAAHPAAILPLLRHRRWFSTTGLIVGSISPDFQYFILLPIFPHNSHSLEGLLFFNLPIAFIIATLFHMLVRRPVVAHLPDWLQQRALAVAEFSWPYYIRRRWLVFSVSVIIGAFSHIFWDSFTHYTGYFAQQWPVLTNTVTILGAEVMYCRVIQHTSTLVGGLAILYYTWRLPTAPVAGKVGAQNKLLFWLVIAAAGICFMVFALYASAFMRSLMGVVVSFITGAMLATIAASMVVKLSWYRQRG